MTARFTVEPWAVGIDSLDPAHLAQEESVFGLSNGHVGWRGNLDEGDPRGVAGSYLNGVFEDHPMPYAEDGYGYPETGQAVINVPNGQLIRLLVGDEPFDVEHGTVHAHTRRLDLRAGTLHREVDWESAEGRRAHIASTRLVSLEHRSLAAVRYRVTAVGGPLAVTVLSEVLANEPLPTSHDDPRVQDLLARPLEAVDATVLGSRTTLQHRTRRSGLQLAVSADHLVRTTGADVPQVSVEADGDLSRTRIRVDLAAGEELEIVKLVGHEWSGSLSAQTLRDRAEEAVEEAARLGWDALVEGQRAVLDRYWECGDVRIDGDARLQQAVRFALFQMFQASARAEARSVPGKGLTGSGYEGHTFWDFEAFVLPVLTSTAPDAALQALRWRHATLDRARERARTLGLRGASFAWRTIDGRESSGYWPASTAAFHINAAVAGAVMHYVRATGDHGFEREAGAEMLVETARLWLSLGRWDDDGGFHLDGVTGPDEYTAVVDDNVYTNLSARRNLRGAVAVARRHPDIAAGLGVDDDEIAAWESAAEAMTVLYDEKRQVHPQSAGFTSRARWDFDSTGPDEYPLHSHFPYFDLYRKQVLKQADLVLALYTAHEEFTWEEKARAFAYYDALTVRDSSLSAAAQAVIAAEVGHLELASAYLAELAALDLDDLHGNTEEGLHIAALAGIWTAVTAGYGGMREGDQGLSFRPQLPEGLTRLTFGVRLHGRILHVDITPAETTYRLSAGEPLTIRHAGDELVLHAGVPVRVPTPARVEPLTPAPVPPRWREPGRPRAGD
ncbi:MULTISPECIES: glycoside hydrolase family 65 protein [Microbacterium]|uniref:glycoside hydrolase family 65 protein n=1 Tax=Microbacterium TaxID=33882 RepID=UPI0011EAB504|nr:MULTISPECIES: glycosyl hydrolase family 65 protein [Microbacterium]